MREEMGKKQCQGQQHMKNVSHQIKEIMLPNTRRHWWETMFELTRCCISTWELEHIEMNHYKLCHFRLLKTVYSFNHKVFH